MDKIIVNEKYLHSALTGKILQGFYTVVGDLVHSLELEVYKQALAIELTSLGLKCEHNKKLTVTYKGISVGTYNVDILVDNSVILKLATKEKLTNIDEIELINQLKLSDIEVGLLLNFCLEGEHKRKVFTNNIKNRLQPENSLKSAINEKPMNVGQQNKNKKK